MLFGAGYFVMIFFAMRGSGRGIEELLPHAISFIKPKSVLSEN
jgi:hypothetical protein